MMQPKSLEFQVLLLARDGRRLLQVASGRFEFLGNLMPVDNVEAK